MCSVTFASHCRSKDVSILLYFLIHEFDTHSSPVPKYFTLAFPDTEICKKYYLKTIILGIVSCKSGNSCFTGIECCIFLTGTGYKSHVLHLGADQNRNVPNKGDVFLA